VVIAGIRVTRRPERERASARARWIGILLQTANLLDHLTVLQNVRVAQRLAPAGGHPDALRLLEKVGLGDRASARPSTLSGGEAARAGLAVALANDPAVLLADEPTGEVDSDNEQAVLRLLRERAGSGSAVVVVTHSERVAAAADRVVQLVDGRVFDG
jgi:putative ABC transport system ATP-binding protein